DASDPLVPFAFSRVRLVRDRGSSLRVRVRWGDAGPELVAADASGAPVFSIGSVQLRPIERRQLTTGSDLVSEALVGLRWVTASASAAEGRLPVTASLGQSETIQAAGLDAPAYPDLKTLEQALTDAATMPELVLAEVPPPAAEAELAVAVHQITEST